MAFSFLGSTIKVGANATSTTTDAFDTTGADLIVLISAFYYAGDPTPTFTDNKSNSFSLGTVRNNASMGLQIAWCSGGTVGSGHTFTVTGSSVYFAPLAALFFSNVDTGSPNGSENGATAELVQTIQPGSVSPAGDDRLFVTGFAWFIESATPTINSSFSVEESQNYVGGESWGLASAYKIQTTGGAENPTWDNGATTTALVAGIQIFNPAAGGGGSSRPIFHQPLRFQRR